MSMLLNWQGFTVVSVPSCALSARYWQNQLLKKNRSELVGVRSWINISLNLERVQGSYTAFPSQIFTCSDPKLLHLPVQSMCFAILGCTRWCLNKLLFLGNHDLKIWKSKELKNTMVDSPFMMVLSCCLSVYARHLFQGAISSQSANLWKIIPTWDLKKAEIRCWGEDCVRRCAGIIFFQEARWQW